MGCAFVIVKIDPATGEMTDSIPTRFPYQVTGHAPDYTTWTTQIISWLESDEAIGSYTITAGSGHGVYTYAFEDEMTALSFRIRFL